MAPFSTYSGGSTDLSNTLNVEMDGNEVFSSVLDPYATLPTPIDFKYAPHNATPGNNSTVATAESSNNDMSGTYVVLIVGGLVLLLFSLLGTLVLARNTDKKVS